MQMPRQTLRRREAQEATLFERLPPKLNDKPWNTSNEPTTKTPSPQQRLKSEEVLRVARSRSTRPQTIREGVAPLGLIPCWRRFEMP